MTAPRLQLTIRTFLEEAVIGDLDRCAKAYITFPGGLTRAEDVRVYGSSCF
jgi:hypothetical protein